jgi:hypothetical protein
MKMRLILDMMTLVLSRQSRQLMRGTLHIRNLYTVCWR